MKEYIPSEARTFVKISTKDSPEGVKQQVLFQFITKVANIFSAIGN